jgi:hypothetical protein
MKSDTPWHSRSADERVHHDNTLCKDGATIETRHLATGPGGRPLCQTCEQLDEAKK